MSKHIGTTILTTSSRFVLAVLLGLSVTAISAQDSGGTLSSGAGGLPPGSIDQFETTPNPISNIQPIQGRNLIAAVSPDGSEVWGYSLETGKWISLKINRKNLPPFPVMGTDVCACQVGNDVFAFGSRSQKWEKVSFPETEKAQVIIGKDYVTAQSANFYYVFSALSSTWSGIALKSPDNPQSTITLAPAPEE
ncbi:hypothetical protein Pla110_12180 [Polystyrenella longa]|uniref:Uncharacterized protein n=1 Tax=Polystyrenella longa TaxID=2528007 RepID=A0A518CJU6_9PLAN|nr:hypothetical protein [Polystyrenella longa]QDU79508.1 hypothetical protein Pla110_12180 [Polystyrenella longa]